MDSVKDDPNSVVLSEDEAALISIPTTTRVWGRCGSQPVVQTRNKNRERKTLFGAVNLKTGQVLAQISQTGNTRTFLSFLKTILRAYPHQNITLILDNVRFHHAKKIRLKFLKRIPRLSFVFLPAYSPNMNPTEWVWKQMRRQVTHSALFPSFQDQIDAATDFFQSYLLPVEKLLWKIIS
jgi:transposase